MNEIWMIIYKYFVIDYDGKREKHCIAPYSFDSEEEARAYKEKFIDYWRNLNNHQKRYMKEDMFYTGDKKVIFYPKRDISVASCVIGHKNYRALMASTALVSNVNNTCPIIERR